MFDSIFTKIYDLCGKYRVRILIALLVITAISLLRLSSISFESNIDLMLPAGSNIARDIHFLQNSDFSDKVVISLKLNDPSISQKKLIAAADRLSEELKPPYISKVVNGLSRVDYMTEMHKLMNYAPQLMTKQELDIAKQKITPEGVKFALKNIYNRLILSPGSSFLSSFASSDPLGIKMPLLTSLQSLNAALGYKIKIINGHFISSDGQHLLLILRTPVKITDIKRSAKLLDYLNNKLKQLPEYVSGSIICGHLHSISNEQVMKKDIVVIISIASTLFFLLFIFMFRSSRAILVFIMPFLSIIISSGICSLFINNLALFVLGMGGVLAGIAIDYGIHVYIAVRVGGNESRNIQRIYKPIMVGALTTIGVLASFFFSRVEGYHQLAFFSVISLFTCVFCSIFLLPHFFTKSVRSSCPKSIGKLTFVLKNSMFKFLTSWSCAVARKLSLSSCKSWPTGVFFNQFRSFFTLNKKKYTDIGGTGRGEYNNVVHKLLLLIWCIFISISFFYAIRLTFNNDIVQFDGSKPEILNAEKQFHKIWGQQNQTAILVAHGDTLNQALKLNEKLYSDMTAKISRDKISSIAPLWMSEGARKKNVREWLSFWQGGEEEKLEKLIKKYSPDFGFSKDAFAPFFKNLYKGTTVGNTQPVFLKDIMKHFIIYQDNSYQILSFFPDTENNVTIMSNVCSSFPNAFVVSRKSLSRQLSQAISSEIL